MRLLVLLLFIVSCASRPQLYPNQKLKSVGNEAAKKDVDKCMADAEAYLKSSKGKQVAKGAGAGAAIGAAMGAASALTPDQIKQRYVNQCLAEKGYQVMGWD